MKIPTPLRIAAVAALAILPCLMTVSRAADLIVDTITNVRTETVGIQHFHKYDDDQVYLSPDGSTSRLQLISNYTFAITVGDNDSEAPYVNAYTAVLASAQGGHTIETALSATRPASYWDSQYAQDFDYVLLGEGEHSISAGSPGFRIWLITLKAQAVISLPNRLRFGDSPIGLATKRTFTISNSGSEPLIVNRIAYPAGFSGRWSGTIQSGASQIVTVTFRPTEARKYSGDIVIRSNASSGGKRLPVSGFGQAEPIP